MGKVSSIFSKIKPVYGKCYCGSDKFKLKMSPGDNKTVECLVCAECGECETVEFDEEATVSELFEFWGQY